MEEDLLLPWAWAQLEARIKRVGTAAVLQMPGHDGTSATTDERDRFLRLSQQVLEDGGGRSRPTAKPREVVNHLQDLVAVHSPGSTIRTALDALESLLRSGPATCTEIDRLAAEASILRERARRTRNSLVHGGPLLTDVATSAIASQDQFASMALRWVLDGQLAGTALQQYVDNLATRFRSAHQALAQGGNPRNELFW